MSLLGHFECTPAYRQEEADVQHCAHRESALYSVT